MLNQKIVSKRHTWLMVIEKIAIAYVLLSSALMVWIGGTLSLQPIINRVEEFLVNVPDNAEQVVFRFFPFWYVLVYLAFGFFLIAKTFQVLISIRRGVKK